MTTSDLTRPTPAPVPATQTHLAVPDARELLVDDPQACPAFPGLTFDGLAVAPDGQRHYLVVTVSAPVWLAACWTEAAAELDHATRGDVR